MFNVKINLLSVLVRLLCTPEKHSMFIADNKSRVMVLSKQLDEIHDYHKAVCVDDFPIYPDDH